MRRVKAGDIQVLGQLSAMQRFVEVVVEVWVNNIKLGNRRLLSSEYNATANVIKAVIVVIGLVGKPAIVIEDIL
jgi:hypothetical protein